MRPLLAALPFHRDSVAEPSPGPRRREPDQPSRLALQLWEMTRFERVSRGVVDAFHRYKTEGNALARSPATGDRKVVERLGRFLHRAGALPEGLKLYRGEWLDHPPRPGDLLERPGLVSTSRSEFEVFENFLNPEYQPPPLSNRVMFRATARPGVRGVEIARVHPTLACDSEAEVLLSDVRFRVRRSEPDFWNLLRRAPLWHVEAELEPGVHCP